MRPIEPSEARAVLSNYVSEEVLDEVLAYEPTSISAEQWEGLRAFCLGLLPFLMPVSTEAFRKQMQALLKFLTWAQTCGYPLDVEVLFTKDLVETWRDVAHKEAAQVGSKMTGRTVGDYVGRLHGLGPLLNPDGGWPPRHSDLEGRSSSHLRRSYTDDELELFVEAISTMPQGRSRDTAEAFLTIGLGFGPRPREYRVLRTSHIRVVEGQVWVAVPGDRERLVPVAKPHDEALLRMRAIDPDAPMAQVAEGKNALARAARSTRLGAKAPTLSPQRLRTTWMVDRLRAGVDPRLMFEWSGLNSMENLPDLVSYLPPPDESASLAAMFTNPRRLS